MPRLPGDVHLNGVNLPHVNAQVKVAVDPVERLAEVTGDGGKLKPGDMHGSHLGKIDLSLAAHQQIGAEIDLSPDADA